MRRAWRNSGMASSPVLGTRVYVKLRSLQRTRNSGRGEDRLLRTLGRAGGVQGHEVRLAGHVDEVRGQLRRPAEEAGGVGELLEDVARVAGPEPEVLAPVVREDLRHRLRLVLDLFARAHALEDLLVLRDGRRLDADLVADATQEGFVDEVGGVEGGREDDQHVERD